MLCVTLTAAIDRVRTEWLRHKAAAQINPQRSATLPGADQAKQGRDDFVAQLLCSAQNSTIRSSSGQLQVSTQRKEDDMTRWLADAKSVSVSVSAQCSTRKSRNCDQSCAMLNSSRRNTFCLAFLEKQAPHPISCLARPLQTLSGRRGRDGPSLWTQGVAAMTSISIHHDTGRK